MSAVQVAVRPGETGPAAKVVNDFSIQVATVNGSGSQTANLVLLRSIFLTSRNCPMPAANFWAALISITAGRLSSDLRFVIL